jgi:hypothetical protein
MAQKNLFRALFDGIVTVANVFTSLFGLPLKRKETAIQGVFNGRDTLSESLLILLQKLQKKTQSTFDPPLVAAALIDEIGLSDSFSREPYKMTLQQNATTGEIAFTYTGAQGDHSTVVTTEGKIAQKAKAPPVPPPAAMQQGNDNNTPKTHRAFAESLESYANRRDGGSAANEPKAEGKPPPVVTSFDLTGLKYAQQKHR